MSTLTEIEGATDSEMFTTDVGKVLRPARRAGDIVIMDNLARHKAATALEQNHPSRGRRGLPARLLARPQPH